MYYILEMLIYLHNLKISSWPYTVKGGGDDPWLTILLLTFER